MNKILNRILARAGGWYVIIAVFVSQVCGSITAILSSVSDKINAEYTPEIKAVLNLYNAIAVPVVVITLLIIVFILTRELRTKINLWKRNPDQFNRENKETAWKDSQNLIWRYALSAILLSVIFLIIPKVILINHSKYATQDQVIYGLISSVIGNIALVPLSTVILDGFMRPVRELMLPKEFSQQLAGLGKLKILYKLLASVFISLVITTLLIAPVGYHQTTRALQSDISPVQIIRDMQIQSIAMSIIAIAFAIALVMLFSQSITSPLNGLLKTIQTVEQGDLNARASVTSTDEVSNMAIYLNRMITRIQELQSNLEGRVKERTAQLQAINTVGNVATSTLEPSELIARVINLITEEFGYYFSAIYLIDPDGQQVYLAEGTGEAGRVLKDARHHLEISGANIIGRCIRSKQAIVALDVGEKATRFDNPLLPYTRSKIALPLFIGDKLLGALDVQSTQEAAFGEEEIEILQSMANQVAISLDNAQLFQETRQRLNEMRNIQKQYLREAWIESKLPQGGMSFAVGDPALTEESSALEIPLLLRDQIIGELVLQRKKTLSPEEETWVQAVATQATLALENARLLEESQGTAMREKFATEITNKIWASTTLDGVLQTTIRELGQILDATEATIELDSEGE